MAEFYNLPTVGCTLLPELPLSISPIELVRKKIENSPDPVPVPAETVAMANDGVNSNGTNV